MTTPDTGEGTHLVLADDTGRHSLWPADTEVPPGRRVVHRGDRTACLDLIDAARSGCPHAAARFDFGGFGDYDRLDIDPRYTRLREQGIPRRVRVTYGEDAWLVTGYHDVRTILADPRFSRADAALHDESRLTPFTMRSSLMGMDPPEQPRLRRLLSKALTMHRVETMRPQVGALATGLADDLLRLGPPADLVAHFALPMAANVVCTLLGVPPADQAYFVRMVNIFSVTTAMTTEEVQVHITAMYDYVGDLISRRRRAPDDQLVSALIQARDEQDRLSELELLELVNILIVAGYDSVSSHLTSSLYALLTHPEQTAELTARPDLLPAAVEELLRYAPLDAHVTFARYATEDIELGGARIRAGDAVLANLPAANRDPAVFADPDTLDFHRARNPHVGLGHGLHLCAGAALTRMELGEAISALWGQLPQLRLAVPEAEVHFKSGMQVRSVVELPVAWGPVAPHEGERAGRAGPAGTDDLGDTYNTDDTDDTDDTEEPA